MPSTKVKVRTEAVSVKTIEEQYALILAEEKELAERKTAIQDLARKHAGASPDGTWGRFSIQVRKSLSWELQDIKNLYPKTWQAFVKPDDAVLRKKTDAGLVELAKVKIVEAIVFNPKN